MDETVPGVWNGTYEQAAALHHLCVKLHIVPLCNLKKTKKHLMMHCLSMQAIGHELKLL